MNNAPNFLSLRTKLMLSFALLSLVSVGVSSYLYYRNAHDQLWTDVHQRLRDSVAIAALQVDAQKYATLTEPSQEGNPTYLEIKKSLQNIRDAGTKIEFVYTMRPDAQGRIIFVVDAEESEEDISHLGDIYEDPGPVLAANFLTMSEAMTETNFYTDEWGDHLSGYAPFYTPDGRREGILGMDISATEIVALQRNLLERAVFIFVGSGFVASMIGLLLGFVLTRPIFVLTEGAKKLAAGDLTHRIAIDTHDEIGSLAQAFNATADNLNVLVARLEQRVEERTTALSRKTSQLNAASLVARQAAAIKDPLELVNDIVHLISDQFGFYHAGIFLLDENREYAVLLAASSEGGQRMLARGHRLKVGEQGVVGYAAFQKRPRIALDTGADAMYFDNSDLPVTRSEAALPLVTRNEVIGVLDIQSESPQAFTSEDVEIFQTLADQLAVAIESARLFSEMEALVQQLQQTAGEQTWRVWAGQSQQPAYQYTPLRIQHVAEWTETQEGTDSLKTPLLLRGRKIGNLFLKRKGAADWSDQEQNLVQELASQVALALENARLLEEAQLRAVRERTLAEITSRIGSAFDVDSVLRTTAQEIGRALGDVEISVHLREDDRSGRG
jgi:GAF domain-containing protein/HAMP domain-containing protein/nitrate reductase NapAB chaperone NapD